jgi:archaeosortase A (PGF-CTERM-specific)
VFGVPSSVYVDPYATDIEQRYNVCLNLSQYCPTSQAAYAVTIILACTAVQSVMIFVGAIFSTEGASRHRLAKAYLYTAPPIYLLNLLRNAGIVYGFKVQGWNPWLGSIDTFELWHSYIGKGGSLIALVLIALAVFKTLPELHSNILDLFDLPKRKKPGFFGGAPLAETTTPPTTPPATSEAPATPAVTAEGK